MFEDIYRHAKVNTEANVSSLTKNKDKLEHKHDLNRPGQRLKPQTRRKKARVHKPTAYKNANRSTGKQAHYC